ncbi:MAG: ABC transporter ATP-binding protein [Chloroflexi bacterium]|nr:ABC transporter ATP-binding protein [Chloroflexota bacterium]|tara:strand:- start:1415 stop:2182 length:768 start_codon:yes stop_codon:yes gene_type:complete
MPNNNILTIENLSKSFDGIQAVNNCTFNVSNGSITGLIGPNGAGKTTVFNLITGFLPPDNGTVSFQENRIDKNPTHNIFKKGLVRTFQIPRELKKMTVLENLLVVPKDQIGEHIWSTIFSFRKIQKQEEININKARDILEFIRLNHLSNEYAGNLSTGQKKLLELARTLMSDPSLVLLDEPVAGVNPTLVNDLMDNIRRSNEELGITFLIIEHNMNFIMNLCDPIIVLSNGAKIAEGTAEEIKSDQSVVNAYLGG